MTVPMPKTLKARKKLSDVNPDSNTGCGAKPSNMVDKMMKTAGAYSGTKRNTHITNAAEKTTTKLVHAQFNEENCKQYINTAGINNANPHPITSTLIRRMPL